MNGEWKAENEAGGCAEGLDATLRVVAKLPAPEGLEERVHEALRAAPRASSGGATVLQWPSRLVAESAWVRSAAAAAIAFVVAGGGWGVYSRVQTARVIEMPSQVQGGFSNAGAKEKTLNGPVIHRLDAKPVVEMTPKKDAVKKAEPAQ